MPALEERSMPMARALGKKTIDSGLCLKNKFEPRNKRGQQAAGVYQKGSSTSQGHPGQAGQSHKRPRSRNKRLQVSVYVTSRSQTWRSDPPNQAFYTFGITAGCPGSYCALHSHSPPELYHLPRTETAAQYEKMEKEFFGLDADIRCSPLGSRRSPDAVKARKS